MLVPEGPVFRKISRRQMEKVVPKLGVLARATAEDRLSLITWLVESGEKVVATADGRSFHDAVALKAASVGVSMERGCQDLAKEASAVTIQDSKISSILQAVFWGRVANDSVQNFLQFQLTINISAIILTFVSSVASSKEQSVLNSVQLLWVNLIMDLFAILALANDPPSSNHRHRKPTVRGTPLITVTMWKMIIGQAASQLAVCFTLYHTDLGFLSFKPSLSLEDRDTLVFNTFVWMQIFNQLNSRRIDNQLKIFEGILHKGLFFIITSIIIGVQCLLIFFGGKALNTVQLSINQWGCSLLTGACTLPIGMATRLFPDAWIRRGIPQWFQKR
jgi:Ca2+-transporting ATPase